jgi:hypothetical protein
MLFPASPLPVVSNFTPPDYSTSVFETNEKQRSSTLLSEVGSSSELTLVYDSLTPSEAIDLLRFWTAAKGTHFRFRLPREIYELMAIAIPDPSLDINLFLEEFNVSPFWTFAERPSIELSVLTIHNTQVRLRNAR